MVSGMGNLFDVLTSIVLTRMMRSIVLNDINLKTLLHHIHKLRNWRFKFPL